MNTAVVSELRVSVVQMSSGADVASNLDDAGRALADAAADGAAMAVLPENFAAIGADEAYRVAIAEREGRGPIQDFLADAAARLGIWIVGGTLPIACDEPARPYSACLVFDDGGRLQGRYHKVHLFDVDIPGGAERYRESAHTTPGDRPLLLDTPWGGLAIAVCYDLRFPELFRSLLDTGFSLIALPAAFTHATGQAHWHALLRARAIENLCCVAAAAQTGVHPGHRQTFGHSMIVGPWGDTRAELRTATGFASATIDLEELRDLRDRFPALLHRRFAVAGPR